MQGPTPQPGDFSGERMAMLEGLLDKYTWSNPSIIMQVPRLYGRVLFYAQTVGSWGGFRRGGFHQVVSANWLEWIPQRIQLGQIVIL